MTGRWPDVARHCLEEGCWDKCFSPSVSLQKGTGCMRWGPSESPPGPQHPSMAAGCLSSPPAARHASHGADGTRLLSLLSEALPWGLQQAGCVGVGRPCGPATGSGTPAGQPSPRGLLSSRSRASCETGLTAALRLLRSPFSGGSVWLGSFQVDKAGGGM